MRRAIEYNSLEVYLVILNGNVTNEENEEELVNYLNFFGSIASLLKYQQINEEEIKDMFGHYLKAMNKNEFLNIYIKDFDFENLEILLKEYE